MKEKNLFKTNPILKSLSKLRKIGYKKVVQNSNFAYGIKIKNIGNSRFEGGIIKNVKIVPFQKGLDFSINCGKKFEIPKLESGDIGEIWFDKTSSPISGEFWLNFDLEKKSGTIYFIKSELFHFNIKNEHLLQQEITNYLLIILTLITIGISIWRLFL